MSKWLYAQSTLTKLLFSLINVIFTCTRKICNHPQNPTDFFSCCCKFFHLDPLTQLFSQVRVYITRAKELTPRDSNGTSDPYLTVKLGTKKFSTKEKYIANELNPFFGEMFEFKCQIPITKDLKVRDR